MKRHLSVISVENHLFKNYDLNIGFNRLTGENPIPDAVLSRLSVKNVLWENK